MSEKLCEFLAKKITFSRLCKHFPIAAIIDVNRLFDLQTFTGRFKYYAWMTDPRTVVVSNERLLQAKQMVDNYRAGKQKDNLKPEEVKYNLKLYYSAFHPDTGELQNFAGRMSFQASRVSVSCSLSLYSYI